MKKTDKLDVITCPHCGREYLPGEIFVGNAFIGRPELIERDYSGKILTFQGKTLDLNEEYICDNCNKKFNITATVKFKVTEQEEFSTEYISPLKEKKLVLFEE